MTKEELQSKIEKLEGDMYASDFWADKEKAQATIREIQELKDTLSGVGKSDKLGATMTLFAGVGGDDAEDFVAMLYRMYSNYFDTQHWSHTIINENKVDHGGYRNITLEIMGKGVYGRIKNESGVHRLVRISPFNAQGKRQTSFAMVEVIPVLENNQAFEIPPKDLKIEFTKSSGPGGQNVNKRETAVRVVHLPTNFTVTAQSERSQEANREKALNLLKAKVLKKQEDDQERIARGLAISTTQEIEWGNQIRSYVLHPYKMVKDHRTLVETSDTNGVLAGDIEDFLEAGKSL